MIKKTLETITLIAGIGLSGCAESPLWFLNKIETEGKRAINRIYHNDKHEREYTPQEDAPTTYDVPAAPVNPTPTAEPEYEPTNTTETANVEPTNTPYEPSTPTNTADTEQPTPETQPNQMPDSIRLTMPDGKIYDFVKDPVTYDEAKATAEINGGHLVTVADAEEQRLLSDAFYRIARAENRNVWIGLEKINGQWQWITGEPLTYTNWFQGTGEPSGDGNYGQFEAADDTPNFEWNDSRPTNLSKYIIEFEPTTDTEQSTLETITQTENTTPPYEPTNTTETANVEPTDTPYEPTTPTNTADTEQPTTPTETADVQTPAPVTEPTTPQQPPNSIRLITLEGKIYDFVKDPVTYDEAKATAEIYNGHLVTVADAEEQKTLADAFYTTARTENKNIWIGLEKINGQWQWITGEPLTYTNWFHGTGEPNGNGDKAQFETALDTPNFEWDDLPGTNLGTYIVEFEGGN